MMMKKLIRGWMLFAFLLLMGTSVVYGEENHAELKEMIQETAHSITEVPGTSGKYILADEEFLPAGTSLSDWIAITLAFSGEKEAYDTYLENLETYVAAQYEANGELESFKATEYHRIALTVLALGKDPTDFAGQNLIADGTYDFHGESLAQQGSNGLIYALLALDALDYEVPVDATFTREQIVEELLGMQDDEGGFALVRESSGDVDITAMALQALAPYQDQPKVAAAVQSALAWLLAQMTEKGTFDSYGSESAESVAQTLLALCALGIDPEEDGRFIVNGTSLMDGLESFRLEDGMYMHVKSEEEGDLMATEQALLALEAVYCLRTEGTWLFDYSDYQFENHAGNAVPFIVTGIAVAAVAVALAAAAAKKKNKQERDEFYV